MSPSDVEAEFERQLRTGFLGEAEDLLRQCEDLFLRLEKAPGDTGIVDHIFRAVHTLKGSGAMVGFADLAAFAHTFETLLDLMRKGSVTTTRAIIDILLGGTDILNEFIRQLRLDHDAKVDVGDTGRNLVQQIQNIVNKPDAAVKDMEAKASEAAQPKSKSVPAILMAGMQELSEEQPPGRKARILVVDDEEDIRELIVDMLTPEGYQILTAGDGEEALAILAKDADIDLLIIDQNMPKRKGSEVIEILRQQQRDISIIVASGATDRDLAIAFITLGVNDFFEKPINKQKFQLTVRNVVRMHDVQLAMKQLSRLNIRSFMLFRKIIQIIEAGLLNNADHPELMLYSNYILEMGQLISRINAGTPESKSA